MPCPNCGSEGAGDFYRRMGQDPPAPPSTTHCSHGYPFGFATMTPEQSPDELAAERRFANRKLNPDPVSALAKTPPPEVTR